MSVKTNKEKVKENLEFIAVFCILTGLVLSSVAYKLSYFIGSTINALVR